MITPNLFIGLLFTLTLFGCDTVKVIYKSPEIAAGYYVIRVVNRTHCGCNEIYADHYIGSSKDFTIFYDNKVAVKYLYARNTKNKNSIVKYLAATKKNINIQFFAPVDAEIFNKIDSLTSGQSLHKLHRPGYTGYLKDTLSLN